MGLFNKRQTNMNQHKNIDTDAFIYEMKHRGIRYYREARRREMMETITDIAILLMLAVMAGGAIAVIVNAL
jgi:hypothetical protein